MRTFLLTLLITLTSLCHASIPERTINKINLRLPFLGLGTVELGRNWGIGGLKSVPPEAYITKRVLETAYEQGVRLIDTASSYQASEEIIGRYLPRTKFPYLLITKPGEHSILNSDPSCKVQGKLNQYCANPAASYDFSREAIFRDVQQSLQKLKVSHLDVVLLHLQNETAAEILKKGEAWQALKELKKLKKVNFIGVSVNGPATKLGLELDGIDIIELEYNLLNQSNKEAIDLAYAKGIGVIVRGGLGTGLLTKYVDDHLNDTTLPYGPQVRALVKLVKGDYELLTQLALAFLYENKHISSVILGADRPAFIKQDIALLYKGVDPKLLQAAKNAVNDFSIPSFYTEAMGTRYFERDSV